LRDRETENLRGLEVDQQLELGGPLDGKIGRLRPLENPIGAVGQMPIGSVDVRPVRHEPTGLGIGRALEALSARRL
jgi:hypothetical protein